MNGHQKRARQIEAAQQWGGNLEAGGCCNQGETAHLALLCDAAEPAWRGLGKSSGKLLSAYRVDTKSWETAIMGNLVSNKPTTENSTIRRKLCLFSHCMNIVGTKAT